MDHIEQRARELGARQFQPELREQIIGRLRAEQAADLSDGELQRCLAGCVMPTKLTRIAMMYRDCGYMSEAMLARSEAAQ